jgi:hypothetical protein
VRIKEEVINTLALYKGLDMELNLAEIAVMAGVSEKYIHKHKIEVLETYKNTESNLDCLNEVIYKGISTADNIQDCIGIIIGTYLRTYGEEFKFIKSFNRTWELGKRIVSVYKLIANRKTDKGTPVHSNNINAKYLLNRLYNEQLSYLLKFRIFEIVNFG